jgi:hypothetical protein
MAALMAAALAPLGCSRAPSEHAVTAPTPDTHTKFPIAQGIHAVSCASCHLASSDSFRDYTCTACHTHEQSATNGVHGTVPAAMGAYSFDSKACVTCHLADPVLAGYLKAGTKGPFSHTGVSQGCTLCHAVDTAFAALPSATSKFDHTTIASTDCSACHVLPAGRAPATADWKGGVSLPSGALFDPRASVQVAVQTPRWSGTSIAALVAGTQALPMPMVHCTSGAGTRCDSGLDSTALSRCSDCHANMSSGGFYPGTFHASVAQQPTACNGCHAVTPPASSAGVTSMPTGFVGPAGTVPPRNPPSSEMRHDAVAWDKETRKSAVPLVTQECGVCHVTPALGGTKQWTLGRGGTGPVKFHASLGLAQPASCNDCHANNRPGQLTQANATGLPPGMTYDHNIAPSQADCVACHKGAQAFTSWGDGLYHHVGDATPVTCLPCHSGARPTATVNPVSSWKSNTYTSAPFDYQTNPQGIGHGNGNDCVLCHLGPGSGAWDGTQTWQKGAFSHAPATDAGSTCVACHVSQRPAAPVPYTNAQGQPDTFDHSQNGTGDCFGCHQATASAGKFVALGDWKGGQGYPGSTPVGAADQFTSTTSFTLLRTSPSLPDLITGFASGTSTLYNQFVHTAPSVPAVFGLAASPDATRCWHCHTHDSTGKVTAFSGGRYHDSLDGYQATPTGAVAKIAQPMTGCTQCHTQRPLNIVEKRVGIPLVPSPLQPMDHAAVFAAPVQIGGVTAAGVAALDCAACHVNPGSTWSDGTFHKSIAAAVPKDCTACHYRLMADPKSDKVSGADFAMQHRSPLITAQACEKCHTGALAQAVQTPVAATLWSGGTYHPGVAAQPTACTDCHSLSAPKAATTSAVTYTMPQGGTATNRAQWVSHTAPSVAGKDCQQCHAADARSSGSAWSKSDTFHDKVSPASCQGCHGLGNGSTTAGVNNNLPSGVIDTSTVSTAPDNPATGLPAGTRDQITHTDVNVASRDCNACHTVSGPSTAAGVQGKEWAQASFHSNFSGAVALVIDGVAGRCSNCHFNLTPKATFTNYDHSKLTQAPGTQDCVACHQVGDTWVGTAVPITPVSDGAHDLLLTALAPSWSGTSISAVSPLPQTLPMPMLHTSTSIAETTSACTNCHANPSTGYSGGLLHSSLAALKVAQPAACLDCHQTSVPVGFVGLTASNPARTPPSSEMRHEAVAWSKDTRLGTPLVTQDCAVCHLAPVAAVASPWSIGTAPASAATYHASLTRAGLAQPGSCLDCHANTRPALLSAPAAALPAGLSYDHRIAPAQSDCIACHTGPSSVTSWTGGRYHLAGSAAPATCLPCHAGERPSASINPTGTWKSNTYTASPFDYLTNPQGITHGNGNDCAACHQGPGTGAWGSTQNWQAGLFVHTPASDAGSTCIACHVSQRPTAPVPYTNAQGQPDTFDHSQNGTGECFGCHQATVTAGKFVALTDWKGGQGYPGASLVGSPTQFITLTELVLQRTAPANPTLITGVTTLQATLANQFLHTSPAVPSQFGLAASPDTSKCWHCHASDGAGHVTSFANGEYHPSLDAFTATPGGAVTPLSQATNRCDDCHTIAPANIVEKMVVVGATSTLSDLQPMDHAAMFNAAVVIGGVSASGVPSVDCSTCHLSPGATWSDGLFHKNIAAAVPKDCTQCHYTLLQYDPALADKVSGTTYAMKHASGQVTFQACQTCHTGALAKGATTPIAATLWSGGVFHASLAAQPTACNDCHTVSLPAVATQSSVTYALPLGGTTSNGAQWMSHKSPTLTGKDCFLCHAADAKTSGSAWSKADSFHAAAPAAPTCQECHGVTNGNGAVQGTKNNLPSGLTNSTTVSSAGADSTTGVPAGTKDQISHADLNVTSRDCNFCHTQAGASTVAGVQGQEWAQAKFHASFTGANTPVYNGTTARCSNCHLNVKPTAVFTTRDHSGFTATSAQDCSACHAAPPTRNDWLGATDFPQFLTVGGFTIPQPPAATAGTIQGGLANLPHPNVSTCASCHTGGVGAKQAFGYDHASAVINTKTNGCNSCHESGSNLVGTVWNSAITSSPPPTSTTSAGDTRPFSVTKLSFSFSGNTCTLTPSDATNFPGAANHFFPNDCFICHATPTGIAVATTGSTYLAPNNNQASAGMWKFVHNETKLKTLTNGCNTCHLWYDTNSTTPPAGTPHGCKEG